MDHTQGQAFASCKYTHDLIFNQVRITRLTFIGSLVIDHDRTERESVQKA